jgi:hypothetical protein
MVVVNTVVNVTGAGVESNRSGVSFVPHLQTKGLLTNAQMRSSNSSEMKGKKHLQDPLSTYIPLYHPKPKAQRIHNRRHFRINPNDFERDRPRPSW